MKKRSNAQLLLSVELFLKVIQMCFIIDSAFGCVDEERQALLELKHSFEDPSNRLASWTGRDCCQWRGLSCRKDTKRVAKLDLRVPTHSVFSLRSGRFYQDYNTSELLSASQVSSCLADLKSLEHLDLSGNYFTRSPIPEFLGSLRNLSYLNISRAGFEGEIPYQLGNLTSLKVLDVSVDMYDHGALRCDNFEWASSLVSLKHLDMSWVDLGEAFDLMRVLKKLPSLVNLQVEYCGIKNGHFRDENYWVNSTLFESVQFLGLAGNELSGEIPKVVHNMTALKWLDMSDQDFDSGGLYAETMGWVSSLSSLQRLDMGGVNLSLSLELMKALNTLSSLSHLSLDECEITNTHFAHATLSYSFFARLQFLSLSGNYLMEPIPTALKNMTQLRELDLSKNSFNSTFPLWLVSSKSLVRLDIQRNQFNNIEGGLFTILNNACSLKSLILSYNSFRNDVFDEANKNVSRSCLSYSLESLYLSSTPLSCSIPYWLTQLENLKYLDLSWNSLSGSIPSSISRLSLLRSLDLSNNQLDGTIPESLGRLSALEHLSLETNKLSGGLPTSLGSFPFLVTLYLSNNHLNETISQSLGKLSSLKYLHISNNQLTGSIPQSLGKLSNLEDLSLSDNLLNGTIPKSIGMLQMLSFLSLSNNQLGGAIPESLARLSSLKVLIISHNKLTCILSSFGWLPSLYYLDISSNPLQGIISETHLANLSSLNELFLSFTDLTWKFKSTWVPPFSLNTLYISSCGIVDENIQWLQTQNQIKDLVLSKNNLFGTFQQWLNATSLTYLDLSMNYIDGKSLRGILNVSNQIETLYLDNNQIKGSMPDSLCNLEFLQVLDLSSNELTGSILNCWEKLPNLVTVSLSWNKLSGELPASLGQLSYLNRFHLHKNNLEGMLPQSLRNCTQLQLLNLGQNRFSGSVPTWIGETLLSLQILRLRNNLFSGIIPPQLCKLDDLKFLDLAENSLIGEIPRCLGNLSGMRVGKVASEENDPSLHPYSATEAEWKREKILVFTKGSDREYTNMVLSYLVIIDLSSNKLVGIIPEELCLLVGLRGLNLSRNHLSGNIPNKIGDLKFLDTLDLSNNKLFGAIPQSMSSLPSISHLNFSNNNLSGKIPTSNQLQTLNDPSIYAGNIQLCGDPLRKCAGDDDPVQDPRSNVHENSEHEDDKKEKILFWFVVVIGYATGFWAVVGTLVFKKNWRIAYFHFMDVFKEGMIVMVLVKVSQVKKRMKKFSHV